MRFLDILKSANQNLLRNKSRTFLTILAIFIGSFTIILNTAINSGVNSFIDAQVASAGGEGHIEMMPKALQEQMNSLMGGGEVTEYNPDKNSTELSYITDEMIEKIKATPGIIPGSVQEVLMPETEFITSEETDRKFVIRVNRLPSNNIVIDTTAGSVVDTKSDQNQINLPPHYAEALGYENDAAIIGETVTIAIRNQLTSEIHTVEAVVAGTQAPSVISMGRAWINQPLDEELFALQTEGLPESYLKTMFLTAEFDPNLTAEELTELKERLSEIGVSAMTVEDQVGMIKTFFDVILVVFSIFGGIALLAASIGIINTLFMSVQERTREIGLMKAMGMSDSKVFLSFSIEAIMIGFWGSILGIVVSMLIGTIGNQVAVETFLSDFPTFTLTIFEPLKLAGITLVIVAIAFLAGTLPARRAATQNPIDALRYE